jgi:membrane-bound metal-dependent hydrolase YbcI (DUF457 family)
MTGLLAGLVSMAVLVPLQWVNTRIRPFPLPVRALLDTALHGLAPAMALAPLWVSDPARGWAVPLTAFVAGSLLDADHVIAFRSLSFETCNSQERRPFGHGLLAAGLASVAGLVFSPLLAGIAAFAVASHVLFDATDESGVPLFWPSRRIVRNVPLAAYVIFLLAGLGVAFALTGAGAGPWR